MAVTVLLDTHALIWALINPSLLSPKARSIVENPSTELFVSSASAWEIAIKHRLGKLPEAEDVVHGYLGHLTTLGATELLISSAHALAAGGLRHHHKDPFDRMIAAQSLIEGIPLLTTDSIFSELSVTAIW